MRGLLHPHQCVCNGGITPLQTTRTPGCGPVLLPNSYFAPPGAHFLEFLETRRTQDISASEAIPIERILTASDCYTQGRFSAESPRIGKVVPQVPRTGRARSVGRLLLQTGMLPDFPVTEIIPKSAQSDC